MNYIFNTNDSINTKAPFLLEHRLKNKIWGLHKRTNWKSSIVSGDNLLFYIAGSSKQKHHIVASASVSKVLDKFSSQDLKKYVGDNMDFIDFPDYKIELESITRFRNPVKVPSIMNKLNLFKKKNHKRWGVYLQGGVTRVNDSDYKFIMKKSK